MFNILGKKKDKKKGELPNVDESGASTSAISEPSTSREATPAAEEGRAGKAQQKKVPAAISESAPPAEPKPEPQPSPAAATTAATTAAVEEEFVGLGLGSSKKKRPRKKKEALPEPSTSAPVISAPVVQAVAFTQPQQVQAPASQPSGWGPRPQAPPQGGSLRQGPPQAFPQSQSAGPGRGGARGQGAAPPSSQEIRPGSGVLQPPLAPSDASTKGAPKIPDKIIGNSVPATPIRVLTNYLPMTFKPFIVVSTLGFTWL